MAELSKRHKRALKLKRENTLLWKKVAQQQGYINGLLHLLNEKEKPKDAVEIIRPTDEEVAAVG